MPLVAALLFVCVFGGETNAQEPTFSAFVPEVLLPYSTGGDALCFTTTPFFELTSESAGLQAFQLSVSSDPDYLQPIGATQPEVIQTIYYGDPPEWWSVQVYPQGITVLCAFAYSMGTLPYDMVEGDTIELAIVEYQVAPEVLADHPEFETSIALDTYLGMPPIATIAVCGGFSYTPTMSSGTFIPRSPLFAAIATPMRPSTSPTSCSRYPSSNQEVVLRYARKPAIPMTTATSTSVTLLPVWQHCS